jgi:hypothetical protein
MAPIFRVKLNWTGFPGAPGLSVFHFRDFDTEAGAGISVAGAQAAVDRIDTFITAIRTYVPQGVMLRTEPEVEVIEEADGKLQDMFTTTPAAGQQGAMSTANGFAAPVGAVINWRTSGVRNGRRIRGRTFLVPLGSGSYQADGTLAAAAQAGITTAAQALIATAGSPDLGVYARPTGPGASDGNWVVATSTNVPDMAAVLRSRRD